MALDNLLGSTALRRVVIHFVVHPDDRLHFRALARHLDLSRQSLRNALDRVEALGLIRPIREGRRVIYDPTEHEGWRTIRELVRTFEEPADVLRDLLSVVPGIHAAFLFGSAAKGTLRPESDIDLFVIEDTVEESELAGAAMEAGITLGRAVDVKRFTPDELRAALVGTGTSYVKRVISGPKRWAIGSPDAIPRMP